MAIIYSEFTVTTEKHYELLLEADPAKELVTAYLERSICIQAQLNNELVGVLILLPTRPDTIEIVNIAVDAKMRAQGIGQGLIAHALEVAQAKAFKTIEIGTGSTSFGQLYLYQKCGFRMIGIDRDFFVRHYQEEISENNLQLKDMVRLSQDISY